MSLTQANSKYLEPPRPDCTFLYEGNGLGECYGNFQGNVSNKPEIMCYGF